MGNTIQESIVMVLIDNYIHEVIKGSLYSRVYGIHFASFFVESFF